MSPALSESSALQRVKLGDALEIRDGIIFDFYLGLPHVYSYESFCYMYFSSRRFSEESFLIRGKTACMCRKMFSLLFKMCIKFAVYVINNSIVNEGLSIFTPQYCYWAYMTFDPHSGSGTTLVPSCSRPPSLSVSSVHSMTSVMWTLTSQWRGLTWTNCGPHLYCESIPTGCTVELL